MILRTRKHLPDTPRQVEVVRHVASEDGRVQEVVARLGPLDELFHDGSLLSLWESAGRLLTDAYLAGGPEHVDWAGRTRPAAGARPFPRPMAPGEPARLEPPLAVALQTQWADDARQASEAIADLIARPIPSCEEDTADLLRETIAHLQTGLEACAALQGTPEGGFGYDGWRWFVEELRLRLADSHAVAERRGFLVKRTAAVLHAGLTELLAAVRAEALAHRTAAEGDEPAAAPLRLRAAREAVAARLAERPDPRPRELLAVVLRSEVAALSRQSPETVAARVVERLLGGALSGVVDGMAEVGGIPADARWTDVAYDPEEEAP